MHSTRRSMFWCLLLLALTISINAQNNDQPTSVAESQDSASATSASASNTASATNSASNADSSVPAQPTLSSSGASDAASSTVSNDPNLPTLANVLPPPLIVPNTADAPFMQKSNLPEGTVFIAVAAVLAFLGAAVLTWRGMVAWSLRRSVQRAANAAYVSDTKSSFYPFSDSKGTYSSLHHNTGSMSLEQLSHIDTSYGGQKPQKRTSQMPKTESRRAPTSSSLFFSPTGAGMQGSTNRASSGHLPSGYYSQGSSAPNGGDVMAHFGGPSSQGYNRMSGAGTPSPPDSPGLRPSRPTTGGASRPSSGHLRTGSGQGREQRRSRLGADDGTMAPASPTKGRAPSAYLEGLMDSHGYGPRERF